VPGATSQRLHLTDLFFFFFSFFFARPCLCFSFSSLAVYPGLHGNVGSPVYARPPIALSGIPRAYLRQKLASDFLPSPQAPSISASSCQID